MNAGVSLPRQSVEAAEAFVRQRTGLVFGESRRPAFALGLARAMQRSKEVTPERYLARLDTQSALLDDLVGEITVGETYFFREPAQFSVIRDEVLPALRSRHAVERQLRVWSAGCATGEEPYSLAIVLREQGLGNAHVIATDLSRAALVAARKGSYTRWSLRGVPEAVTRTYFDRTNDRYQLATSVREAVEFRYLNLAEDAYPSLSTGIWGMDIILCRNVLIYFDADTIARVAARLIDSLSDQGWLLLGASDPGLAGLVDCEVMVTASGLAYRRFGNDPVRTRSTFAHGFTPPRPEPLPLELPTLPPAVPFEAVVQEAAPVVEPGDHGAVATKAYRERDYERAAVLAAEMVHRDGTDPEPWVVLVRALANRGELDAAGRACAAALDHHRESPELVYLHAVLLAEAGLHSDAATAVRRALYLDRKLVVGHLLLGGALGRLGDLEGARRAVGNAQRLLAELESDTLVPASDGEPAGRLAEMARVQLELLREALG